MTNSYDVDHGLSQDAPGPLGLEAPDDTLARTGNTARDQEMYAAGIRTGEENAKHNAAIRAGVSPGYKLVPIEPTDAMLDAGIKQHRCEQGDPWYSSPDLGEGDCRGIYAAMLNAAPAAPGASTAGNLQAARDWELSCDECDGSGHVYVKHQVAERQSDVQEFKEECECCEGRGFVFAFQDIPGIEEYVKTCRPAPAAPGVSTVEDAGAQKEAVMDAIADALGDAYDCTRVWHAWSYGTMGPDDFALVAADPSRVAEIATAAIAAMRPAPAAGDAQTAATRDVLAERQRQISAEGWTPDHDDQYQTGQLASAAGCYAMFTQAYPAGDPVSYWPWSEAWWKPSAEPRRNLVKAGALILAEIERLDRAAQRKGDA